MFCRFVKQLFARALLADQDFICPALIVQQKLPLTTMEKLVRTLRTLSICQIREKYQMSNNIDIEHKQSGSPNIDRHQNLQTHFEAQPL